MRTKRKNQTNAAPVAVPEPIQYIRVRTFGVCRHGWRCGTFFRLYEAEALASFLRSTVDAQSSSREQAEHARDGIAILNDDRYMTEAQVAEMEALLGEPLLRVS
jgi:hypothetical protein